MLSAFSKALRHDRRGETALQFAMVAPAFLMLLLGTMEVGRFYFTQQTVRTLSAETARQALAKIGQNSSSNALNGTSLAVCPLSSADQTAVKTNAIRKTPFLNTSTATTYTVSCSISSSLYVISVSLTYPYTPIVPYLSFFGAITDNTQVTTPPMGG